MRSNFSELIIYFFVILAIFFNISHAQTKIGEISIPSRDFHRIVIKDNSFASFLRQLPLNKPGSDVLNHRGGVFKSGNDTSVAFVVDMNINGRRLEQCMDILVRIYAEYLWENNLTEDLNLPIPGGYRLAWQKWMEGFRPAFKGINMSLNQTAPANSTIQSYRSYLNTVYSESHTQQFYHAYQTLNRTDVQIGDIIIKRGTKGHAVMIVDLAINKEGNMIALIGNGDTPACQFFLLNYRSDQPWVPLDFTQETLSLPLKRKMSWDGLRRFSLPKN